MLSFFTKKKADGGNEEGASNADAGAAAQQPAPDAAPTPAPGPAVEQPMASAAPPAIATKAPTVNDMLTEAFPAWSPDEGANSNNGDANGRPTTPPNSDHIAGAYSVATTPTRRSDILSSTANTLATTPQSSPSTRHATPISTPGRASISFPSSNYSPPRSRRTRNSLANRSQPELHAARVQRSATLSSVNLAKRDSLKESKSKTFQRHSYNNSSQVTTDSTPDQQGLAKMEMQKWITVQQKTFTKWCVCHAPGFALVLSLLTFVSHSLGSTPRSRFAAWWSRTWLPT
jgi:hypothetical protein